MSGYFIYTQTKYFRSDLGCEKVNILLNTLIILISNQSMAETDFLLSVNLGLELRQISFSDTYSENFRVSSGRTVPLKKEQEFFSH